MDWLGWLTAIAATAAWIWERRERSAEKRELDEIRRRATGPYLRPSIDRFNFLYFDNGKPGEIGFRPAEHAANLSWARVEVERDVPAGHRIYMVLDISGEDCPEVSVSIGEHNADIKREIDVPDSGGRYYLAYDYRPDDHGKEEVLELKFLSSSGVRDVHKYLVAHGKRVLRRIDPA